MSLIFRSQSTGSLLVLLLRFAITLTLASCTATMSAPKPQLQLDFQGKLRPIVSACLFSVLFFWPLLTHSPFYELGRVMESADPRRLPSTSESRFYMGR